MIAKRVWRRKDLAMMTIYIMNTIDIRKIKTVFICPDNTETYKKRCVHMFELLRTLGFERVVHYKSGKPDDDSPYPQHTIYCK
jgi:hypothetical protein